MPLDLELPLTHLPETLHSTALSGLARIEAALSTADMVAEATGRPIPSTRLNALSIDDRRDLAQVLVASDYVADVLARMPDLLPDLLEAGRLEQTLSTDEIRQWCQQALSDIDSEEQLHKALRQFRRAFMVRLIWRDALHRQSVWQTSREISDLADVTVEAALSWLEQANAAAWGQAFYADGEPMRLVVLGMGKLGARELNLSSDIDLIFAFAAHGETQGGRRSFEHQEYFSRLGRKLIAALSHVGGDDFVFRVDMRLRPYGESGALVLSFPAMAEYYQDQGREWERYAMIKARVMAGDRSAGERLLAELAPFVYRKYLDFSAIESLRAMKALINREVRRKGLDDNIKLGRGGIREVEFITQVFQLIRGGRDTELQTRAIAEVLPVIAGLGLMPASACDELKHAYSFLRQLEHALQGLADKQTQTLPDDEASQARIAYRCGFADWSELMSALDKQRVIVRRHFDAVIAAPDEESDVESSGDWHHFWQDDLSQAEAEQWLSEAGYPDAPTVLRRLKALRDGRPVQSMQRVGRERLDTLMPLVLEAVAQAPQPDVTLERILWLIEAVLRRTAYLLLLTENPGALQQLVRMCAASEWLAEQLARMPILLDELLTPETLYTPADRDRLADELRQHLGRVPEDDVEAQMEALRYFRHANALRVAASDIVAQRHLMKVSDFLTYIAEVVLDAVFHMAWQHLVSRYGQPMHAPDEPCDPGFLIVGYGKLGGIELGYGSDLDLVFLHDANPQLETQGGQRSLDGATFYTRLGQRIIHLLSTVTPSGQLYDVDMRLRPSGTSGLLVSTLKAFHDYQEQEAWTWEHQALVRARVIAGDPALAQRFEAVRAEILGQPRALAPLREEVIKMRQKMRDHLGSTAADQAAGSFHIKQDAGGIVDIEFLVQYAVLAWSHQEPALLTYTDNMRILDTLAETSLRPEHEVRALQAAYLDYRRATHEAALSKRGNLVEASAYDAHRQTVMALWQAWLDTSA
ncbi:bifunctional glutamine synthetase adenylyltransferase/deadenyltransferase [Terasakiispira papahanaumokuakeensis]|uniref:Bifunctional glutamine synthetase adenylyltransferase/adenylyl-removing enzyme n=1 Tax=Terasakiispira papahanaumokuakeensis TaxID=197479 RepID=A0A1E2V5S1_9GAMM|nr:bifunctional [glutamate--ammonia ligase]-adenylyl-L-tyrosine phosphorylase/[glutamate--ammonia-ligase] adenylyltransferase [Terasakiispira papahanaumokuakeensis]ODC02216.1 bifunctional glutamine synthetase adenylyltransferase/deadenyltransferase [Terasakiispira papahanaumokuakeensis]